MVSREQWRVDHVSGGLYRDLRIVIRTPRSPMTPGGFMLLRWFAVFLLVLSRRTRTLAPLLFFLGAVFLNGGCSSCTNEVRPTPQGVIACKPQHPTLPTVSLSASEASDIETVSAGMIPVSFSTTSAGDASLELRLRPVPGRRGVEPSISLNYSSSAGDSVVGRGFSITGASAITRCPSRLVDGDARDVQYDQFDQLCLDGKPLAIIGKQPGTIEYRTKPDTHAKIIGHDPDGDDIPQSFEVFTASGMIISYGTTAGTRPRGPSGVPRAYLAAEARNGRGDAMDFGWCFADADEYTAEYALDQITYTRFEGSPALEATRAVKFVHGIKDPADIRTHYSRGMKLQSSLRVDEIQMIGPGNELVRSYPLTYELSPTNHTLLAQVEECSGGVCKPPTRFQYRSSEPGFKEHVTNISTPTSKKASPLIADIDSDGLDDLIVPDMDEALSTPQNPITRWLVAHNDGPSASPAYLGEPALAFSQEEIFVNNPDVPSDPTMVQPEVGTALDYDQDGFMDVLSHDVHGVTNTWHVLLAQPKSQEFTLHDTGIPRPFPLGVRPLPPMLNGAGGSTHLADIDGDRVSDLIQCHDHGDSQDSDPSKPVWRLHLWKPKKDGMAAGFDPEGEPIDKLAGLHCAMQFFAADLNNDGKMEMVMTSLWIFSDGTEQLASTYYAHSRRADGTWEISNTNLPVISGGRVLFMDVNGDQLPDAVQDGYQDHALRTYINTGPTFTETPVTSLGNAVHGNQDLYFNLAAPLDWNSDGRTDLLMPVPPGTLPSQSDVLPAWAIFQAKVGSQSEATFTLVDPKIPFEAELSEAITLADPRGPRIGDVNGDGSADVVLPLGGVFHIFENLASDQDLLIAVSDGMNDHDPEEPEFVPNVSISYGHLIDTSITIGAVPDDPALESALYLSRASASNDCAYPRRCAVGPRRVVSGYAVNDGSGGVQRFSVRYRDGRYDRRGLGFLYFGERIVTDLDTLAGTADFFDNVTFDADLKVYPFAGQVKKQWRWSPGLPDQPKPDQIELSFIDIMSTLVRTNDGMSYFTLPTQSRLRLVEGTWSPGGPALEAYVRNVESKGGTKVLRDTTAKVTDFDAFGNVLKEELSTAGVDLTFHVDRTYKSDTDRWVLRQLQTQEECSTAAKLSKCRTLTRTTTIYGEIETESVATSDGSPETKRTVTYQRDGFGNVTGITADDAFGHHRSSTITYDPEGIFPTSLINAERHTSFTEFDARFGALAKLTDPNGLVTEWMFDRFGRVGLEKRPDGTQTTVTLARTRQGEAWRVAQRTTTSGGADDTVEFDSRGRPIRLFWHGPTPQSPAGEPPRLMQKIDYDARTGKVLRRSVPVSEGTAESKLLFDEYRYDAVGREVRHTMPWNASVKTSYDGLLENVTDPLGNVTITEHDPLGRPVVITDPAKGITSYSYGPFGWLYTVTDPGTLAEPSGAVTITIRDALGRVKQIDDPDRGTMIQVWNGWGELQSSTDAIGRESTFVYDGLGRTKSRVDKKNGALALTTTWTWDTAPNGIGEIHKVTSPDGEKTYAYNKLGQLEGLTLAVNGAGAPLEGKLGYDAFGRVKTITYPTPAGASSFIVTQDFDPFGHVLKVHDGVTSFWRLTDVDNAGRFRTEVFGNDVLTERSYFPDKQRIESIVTQGATMVQSLAYDYDARLSLKLRTDTLQMQNKTERFRYDALDRVTCAYFSAKEDPFAPCASSYAYDPNGNLTFKSDVGVLSYNDPAHPHAVTSAGGDSFGYDAVGNQFSRPGGVIVTYTPFDLPKTISQGATTIAFGYDGDEKRIRKTTPDKETIYFEGLYERVTIKKPVVKTEHRYFIHSPERAIAVVTRGGDKPGALYVHADNLGSVEKLTNDDGVVVERRSGR
ncbi:MAG TPA: SpvB/TcaC N-terminal domain-containing protein, partial [Polyangiaceae bacterium]|nr:SpvB/TcaC N-terminal domain-containing protein [Polyangiaceae bacterium]